MLNELCSYPVYKASNVEYFGDLPEHWRIVQLGRIGVFSKGSGGTKEDEASEGIPCVRYGDLYTTHRYFISQTRSYVTSEKAGAYTPINRGDVLFPTSGETIEEIGKSAVNLQNTQVVCGGDMIIFRPTIAMEPKFAGYALDCPAAQTQKSLMGRGITIMHIYSSQLKYLWLPVPPLDEQRAIVRYLDYVDRRIRRYVSAKQKLIALLEEEKQAVVNQAVTRGLDPNVPLKPSGVEWLGDVPAHWDVAALRLRYAQCLGKMLDSKRITGNHSLPYLRNVDVQWDRINIDNLPVMDIPPDQYDRYTVEEGDLLVCEGGEVGRSALWQGELVNCGFQKALHRLRPLNVQKDVPRFMYYSLRAAARGSAFDDGHVSTIAHLTGDKLRAQRFPFPPLAEQRALVTFLDRALKQIERGISATLRQIQLVQEYRTRIVADVVTGKLDVREAAARLPEGAGEAESIDEEAMRPDSMDGDPFEESQPTEEEIEIEREVTV